MENKINITNVILFCLLLFSMGVAEAGTRNSVNDKDEKKESKEKVDLGTVTVIASPVVDNVSITRYGDRVDVVTHRQIDDMNASDLATALYRVPGVMMSRHNFIGSYGGGDGGAVFIRGHGSSRPGQEIGTLIDGVPKFSGVWNHSLLDMLSVDTAGAVDVYKSAQPVLFGNMSFSAINIKPKRMVQSGNKGRVLMEYGAYQTWMLRFEYGARKGPVDYYFTGSHRNSDGHRLNSGGSVQFMYGRAGYDLGDGWNISFQVHHTNGWAEDPEPEGQKPLPLVEKFNTKSGLYIVNLSHETTWGDGSFKLYLDDGLQDWEQWDAGKEEPFSSVTDYSNYGVRMQERLYLWKGSEVLLGLDSDWHGGNFIEKRDSGDLFDTDLSFRNTAPYLMFSQSLGDDKFMLTFSAGARYNFSRHYDDEVGYQGGISLRFAGLVLYGNYANSFNLPGVYSAILFGGGPGGDAWQELKAERIEHLEVGITHHVSDAFIYTVSLFQDDVENALRVTFPGPRYANVGNYTSKGVEFGMQLVPINGLEVFTGLTLSDNEPDDLPYAPELTFVGGLNYLIGDLFKVGMIAQHVSEYYTGNPRTPAPNRLIDDYTVLNLRAGFILADLGIADEGELFVAVENLTGTTYKLKPDYPMPGTTLMCGFDLRF